MRPMFASCALVIAALLAPARADAEPRKLARADAGPRKRSSLGDGYELVITGQTTPHELGKLEVRKGSLRARIGDAIHLNKVVVDATRRTVDVDVEVYDCDVTKSEHHTWTFAQLDARLANTAAYALHAKKNYKAAAVGFARAAAADPSWRIPAYNLASAHTLLGDHAAAIQALSPWLTAEPVATFVRVTSDPELSPLLVRPELAAIRAAQPGAATLGAAGLDGEVAYAPALGLLAVTRTEKSWATCGYQTVLELHAAATGALVATTPLTLWAETSSARADGTCVGIHARARPAVDARAGKLQTMLIDLGFVTVPVERGSAIESVPTKTGFPKQKSVFRKIGLVAANRTARVLAGNTELATAAVLDTITAAVFVPQASAVIVWSLHPVGDVCASSDPSIVTVLPIKSAPSRP